MQSIKEEISLALQDAVKELAGQELPVKLEHPVQEAHGDYATNIALIASKSAKKPAMEVAESLAQTLQQKLSKDIKVSVAKPGFINFTVTQSVLLEPLETKARPQRLASKDLRGGRGKKVMVEYAHPNTHKEMHIGHMRTLITGEAICRLLEATGAKVFRANYQGDIGPHVAKAIWGIRKIMDEKSLNLEKVEGWSGKDKAHFLGEGYIRGNKDYDSHKEEIDNLNSDLYAKKSEVMEIYKTTRQWSLDYYEDFYKRFSTVFDHLFFESE